MSSYTITKMKAFLFILVIVSINDGRFTTLAHKFELESWFETTVGDASSSAKMIDVRADRNDNFKTVTDAINNIPW